MTYDRFRKGLAPLSFCPCKYFTAVTKKAPRAGAAKTEDKMTSPRQSMIPSKSRGFAKDFGRGKKHKIKRGGRKRPPLAHKAPQCGAFYDWG